MSQPAGVHDGAGVQPQGHPLGLQDQHLLLRASPSSFTSGLVESQSSSLLTLCPPRVLLSFPEPLWLPIPGHMSP